MKCPNCQNRLTEELLDKQDILHCDRCGSSFFEENGINRISVASAQELASEMTEPIILGVEKFCPKDKAKLNVYTSESVPPNVTLLTCPLCSGMFAYPDDLVRFKKAQTTKVAYFKMWATPLPNLSTVLAICLIAIVAVSTLGGLAFYVGNSTKQTNASDLIKSIFVTTSGRYTFISFRTSQEFTSEIVLEDIKTGEEKQIIVSSEPKTLHTLTTTLIEPSRDYAYKIILIDDQGRSVVTEKKRLSF